MSHIMHRYFAAVVLAATATSSFATEIWTGPSLEFSKAPLADPSMAANQDRITEGVWITRGSVRGLYNAASESSQGATSPAGTMWAVGTTADLGTLTFDTWLNTVAPNPPAVGPPDSVGVDLVLHLVESDIFIDLRFTEWGLGNGGGGSFAYVRSTPSLESGDFNGDGAIDAADYTIWRDTVGSGSDFRADANGDLAVDEADYSIWRATYGDTTSVSVPEPVGIAPSAIAALGWHGKRRARRQATPKV